MGTVIAGEVTLDKMAGVITSEDTALAAGTLDPIVFFNNRVAASSVVMMNIGDSAGCEPLVYKVKTMAGRVDMMVKNIGSSDCTQACTLNFLVIN